MVTVDMDRLKDFLVEKNNAGELNIDKLGVVGAGMGASVAVNWARRDLSWPQLPTHRQGQDVKALVLLSPEWSTRGLPIKDAFASAELWTRVSVLIVVGDGDRRAADAAKRVHRMFERGRPEPREPKDKDLLYVDPKTHLQGIKLLNESAFQLRELIGRFIDLRLIRQSYPWTNRRTPLQQAFQ